MKRYSSYIVAAVLLLILCVLPPFISSYYVALLTMVLIFGLFAMSLDILVGYTGLPSLGHAAFFGTSAYAAAILNVKIFQNFGVELVTGLAAAAIVAAIYGLLALRTRGVYFLMITLALGMVAWGIAFSWFTVTGGDDGLPGISRPDLSPIPWNLGTTNSYFYFTLVFCTIAAIVMYLIVRSPFGYVLRGIRESETRMSSLGYNVWRYKYVAFIVAGVFAGLAGILFAYYNRFVSPVELNIVISAEALLMTILGGAGTLFGPLLGAGVIIFVKNFVSAYTEHWTMILGALYILVIVFAPQGIYGPIKNFLKRWIPL